MIKFLLVFLTLTMVFTSIAAADTSGMAVGIYGDLLAGQSPGGEGLGLSLKWNNFPVLGISWNFSGSGALGASLDYWVWNQGLGGTLLSYYLGLGAFAGVAFGTGGSFDIGARVPIGLQLFPINKLEIFLEGAPEVGFVPSINLNGDVRLGVRVHL